MVHGARVHPKLAVKLVSVVRRVLVLITFFIAVKITCLRQLRGDIIYWEFTASEDESMTPIISGDMTAGRYSIGIVNS